MLWAEGLEAEAEGEWSRVSDARYKDIEWVTGTRKWPPATADALNSFLELRSVAS